MCEVQDHGCEKDEFDRRKFRMFFTKIDEFEREGATEEIKLLEYGLLERNMFKERESKC